MIADHSLGGISSKVMTMGKSSSLINYVILRGKKVYYITLLNGAAEKSVVIIMLQVLSAPYYSSLFARRYSMCFIQGDL